MALKRFLIPALFAALAVFFGWRYYTLSQTADSVNSDALFAVVLSFNEQQINQVATNELSVKLWQNPKVLKQYQSLGQPVTFQSPKTIHKQTNVFANQVLLRQQSDILYANEKLMSLEIELLWSDNQWRIYDFEVMQITSVN